MPQSASLGQTPNEVLDAFHAASRGSYPTTVEARDQIGRVFRWCPDLDHPIASLGRVQGFLLHPLTDSEHLAFEESLATGRIQILEHRRSGYERVLHDAQPLG